MNKTANQLTCHINHSINILLATHKIHEHVAPRQDSSMISLELASLRTEAQPPNVNT